MFSIQWNENFQWTQIKRKLSRYPSQPYIKIDFLEWIYHLHRWGPSGCPIRLRSFPVKTSNLPDKCPMTGANLQPCNAYRKWCESQMQLEIESRLSFTWYRHLSYLVSWSHLWTVSLLHFFVSQYQATPFQRPLKLMVVRETSLMVVSRKMSCKCSLRPAFVITISWRLRLSLRQICWVLWRASLFLFAEKVL